MGFNCAIIGLPNVGKSTLFNALTQSAIAAENFPFCTIEPNIGIVAVPDQRLFSIANIAKSVNVIPASMNFVDVAGLVKGASKGEGLGNQFLSHIRESDAIAQVVRCFEDERIIHVNNQVLPIDDIETINTELILADLESCDKMLLKQNKRTNIGDKDAMATAELLQRLITTLNQGKTIRSTVTQGHWDPSVLKQIAQFNLLTAKPMLYIANVSEDSSTTNAALLQQLEDYAQTQNTQVIPLCNQLEQEIAQLDEEDKLEFLQEIGADEPSLNRLIRAGYELLGLQTYFTAGPKEARAWTVKQNATAPQAAGKIHTDFETGFIRAEVISYQDYIDHQGEAGAKEAGKWRLEGKDYLIIDGDVVRFRFNN